MTPSWTWAGARAIGTAHLQSGAPCQDAFACHVSRPSSDSEILIAALADGAGSAARAEAGAKLATSIFVDVVRERLEVGSVSASQIRDVVRLGVEAARVAVAAIADHEARATDDFASTLLVAILHADGGAVGQIGDGAIVVTDGAKQDWRPALWPHHGEYVNTTHFLTDADALEHLRIEELTRPVISVCLFSDGLERLVLDFRTRTAHAPFFHTLFKSFPEPPNAGHAVSMSRDLTALLASDSVNRRTDDDKSILCATLLRPDYGAPLSAQD